LACHIFRYMTARRHGRSEKRLYERVPISELLKGRRGKHNELILGVLRDLSTLPIEEAIRIPLKRVGGVSLANLRSAISRAARIRKIKIRTYSDSDYLYLWKPEVERILGVKKLAPGRSRKP
jgi:hypothetical protein